MNLTQFYHPENTIPVEERLECFLYERWEDLNADRE